MADENIEIGVGLDPGKAKTGLEDLTAKIQALKEGTDQLTAAEKELEAQQESLNSQMERFGEAIGGSMRELGEHIGLMEGRGAEVFGGFIEKLSKGDFAGVVAEGFKAGLKLIEETNEALNIQVGEYEKLHAAYGKFADKQEALANKKGGMRKDDLDDNMGYNPTGAAKENLLEIGRMEQGYGAKGTMLGWAQRVGDSANKNFFGALGMEDETEGNLMAAGKKGAERNRAIEKNNEKYEQEQAQILKEMEEAAEQAIKDLEKENKANEKKAAQYKKNADAIAAMTEKVALEMQQEGERAEAKIASLEGQKINKNESFERQNAMRDITRQSRDRFEGGIDTNYDAMYNRLTKAGGSSGKTPEEIAKEQDALRKEWHEKDQAKLQEQIDVQKQIVEKLGLK